MREASFKAFNDVRWLAKREDPKLYALLNDVKPQHFQEIVKNMVESGVTTALPNLPHLLRSEAHRIAQTVIQARVQLGKNKFRLVQLGLDFARVVFGRPGKRGCTVVVYVCPHCCKVPQSDYDYF